MDIAGNEATIVTKDGSLLERLSIDKQTGWMKRAYEALISEAWNSLHRSGQTALTSSISLAGKGPVTFAFT
jgi:hypothetical protein